MKWSVTAVKPIADKTLQVYFKDGTQGKVTFAESFFRGVFTKIKDPVEFAKAKIDYGTVTWLDELDIAPDALYERIKAGHGECVYA